MTTEKIYNQKIQDLEKVFKAGGDAVCLPNDKPQTLIEFLNENDDLSLRLDILGDPIKSSLLAQLEELQLKLIAMSCFAQEHFNEKACDVTKMNIDEIKHWIKKKRSEHCNSPLSKNKSLYNK